MKKFVFAVTGTLSLLAGCSESVPPIIRHGNILSSGEAETTRNEMRTAMRIVGGTSVPPNKYPWMVQVQAGDGLCGGTLVRPDWVLTAAHCFYENGSNTQLNATEINTSVRIGNVAINQGQQFNVSQIIHHPNYQVGPLRNDVTLLRLATPVPSAQVIAFATANSQFSNITTSTAIGWGTTAENGDLASILQEVNLPLLTNEQCNTQLAAADNEGFTGGSVTDVMICAGGQGGQDSCQGDSGGPLIVNTPNGFLQVGVTSFGVGCARPNRPGVYARTSAAGITSFLNSNLPTAPTPMPTLTPSPAPTTTPPPSPVQVSISDVAVALAFTFPGVDSSEVALTFAGNLLGQPVTSENLAIPTDSVTIGSIATPTDAVTISDVAVLLAYTFPGVNSPQIASDFVRDLLGFSNFTASDIFFEPGI